MTDTEIARRLRLGRREAFAVRDMLLALVREGELLTDARGRFGTAEQFGAKKGVFTGNERGFGFFAPDDGSGDLFIPRRATLGALHLDTVLAIPVAGKSDDEGEILAILSRGYREIVGTFHREGHIAYVVPDEKKLCADILIPAGKQCRCKEGAKAVVRIRSYDPLTGEIGEILGESGEFFTEERALIRAHGLRETFPEEVLSEAERQARGDPAAECGGRLDLRGECIITVDGEDTRDIDDAISVKKSGKNYELGVHIADVSHYVKRNSPLDREAFERGTSVYFPDRVLPMLPPALSNGICSLNEGADRLTLSCLMTVNAKGKVIKKKIVPSVIRSRHRMTYTDVTRIAEGDPKALADYPDLVDFVQTAVQLTHILKNAREQRGGVALDIRETKIIYEDGKIEIPNAPRTVSHDMIEQFMVLANESVAAIMTEMHMPFVYRVHEKPTAEKAEDFIGFLSSLGITPRFRAENVSPADYRELLHGLEGSPYFPLVNRVMLRSMMKAQYSPVNAGHFGLASDCYCHFTSPIRRYPDLCIHRIIKDALISPEKAAAAYGEFVKQAAIRSSMTEKNAAEAERDVDALYIVGYMQDKTGEEYDATVSGVTGAGLFAELENAVEGFLPLEALPDDYYEFLETHYILKGMRNAFTLGQKVRVRVDGVDWGARKVLFGLVKTL